MRAVDRAMEAVTKRTICVLSFTNSCSAWCGRNGIVIACGIGGAVLGGNFMEVVKCRSRDDMRRKRAVSLYSVTVASAVFLADV